MGSLGTAAQAVRFTTGLRRFLGEPVTYADALRSVERRWASREARFLAGLDRLVWPHPASPHRRLLEAAGCERGDVADLVTDGGLPGALEALRDAGVYTSYEEYLGQVPARRGGAELWFGPDDFLNPSVTADYMGSSSGTRSGGTAVGKSFRHLHGVAQGDLLHRRAWQADGAPSAVWLPVLPSSAGLNNVLRLTVTGDRPERWFSHVDPGERRITPQKQVVNRLLPRLSRLVGTPLPRPEHAAPGRPDPVLAWCIDALARRGRAFLVTYPTSAVALGRAAVAAGVRLDGLVLRLGGEPATLAKREAIRASGAEPANCYAFAQMGRVAMACPDCEVEDLHVLEQDAEVVHRRRDRGDGVDVEAFLWTSLDGASPSVMLNVESDDYGSLRRDAGCGRLLHDLGMRTVVGRIRGMSKVVTGGITLGAEALERLAEEVLPRHIGGGPGHYQFAEEEREGRSRPVVRVDPAVGGVRDGQVVDVVDAFMRETDLGVLAQEVWRATDGLRVVREPPVASPAGKQLVFEPLRH